MPFEREYGETQTVAIALGQFALALGLEEQWQVGKAGHGVFPTERAVEQHVQRCRWQPLLATDNVAYLHQMVVYDVGKMVSGQLVSTLIEHLVVEDVALDDHVAAYHVVDMHLDTGGDEEAHHILLAVGYHLAPLCLGERQRVSHLHAGACIILEILYLGALGVKLLGRVEGIISLAVGQELVYVLLVDVATLTLAVGTMVATEADALVKLDAEPLE